MRLSRQSTDEGLHKMLEGLLVLRGYLGKGIKFSEFRMPAEYSHGKAVGKEFTGDGAMLGAQPREERLPEVQKGRRGLGDVSWRKMLSGVAILSRRMYGRKMSQTTALFLRT